MSNSAIVLLQAYDKRNNMKFFLLLTFVLSPSLFSDVHSTKGVIQFDSNADASSEMFLNSTGLGIGLLPSSNLHVKGNVLVSKQLFMGKNEGSSNLNIHGTFGLGIQTISSNSTLSDHSMVLVDSSSSNILLHLPEASVTPGRNYRVKKISLLNSIFIRDGGQFDQFTDLCLKSQALGSLSLVSCNGNWQILYLSGNSVSIASDNLVGWWKLDETSGEVAYDSSSHGHAMTLLGNLSATGNSTTGKIKNSLSFTATASQYAQVSDHDDLDLGTGANKQFTVSLWYKSNASNQTATLMGKRSADSSGNSDYYLFFQAGFLIWGTGSATDPIAWLKITEPSANVWHHVVATLSSNGTTSGIKKLYIDGNLISSGNYTAKAPSNNSNLNISKNVANTFYFNGLMDDIRIYNIELTQQEIMQLSSQ